MADTTKVTSKLDQTQILQNAFTPVDGTLAVGGFLSNRQYNKVEVAYPSSTTETYSFYEGSTPVLLYVFTLVYTDSSKTNLSSAERTT